MGCDAHMYVEYKRKKSERDYWFSFGKRINPGRNYWLFGLMSKGVRSEFPKSLEAKGMPDNAAYESRGDNQLYIVDENPNDTEGWCTMEQAKQWETYGCKFVNNTKGNPTWITHPDWHSHTWLTTEEFKKVIDSYNSMDNSHSGCEYEVLLSAMQKLEEFDNEVRVVVWFDN